ncbi:NirD/YgiW/YdeI family stress tolerance protein [Acinetobacter bohemicus]|uniref:NirD/YgiW/YdeI family stress tolerance protein n=1 Tax=Acinetobacter sp. S4397-1 TaxID=2972915 RepID=UPI00209AE0D3|nr:NirD/YgiW/YdeI family stress tolerance protein [Acinetobacter sp. S4397-1]MCO8046490.1 NirD/YgiW/YdeI family stress tolerance protein [Acinetobacter sp. S4397-1]
MKQYILATLVVAAASPTLQAKSDQALMAEAQKNVVSIAQVHKMKDETGVTVVGQIIKQRSTDSDEFELKDRSGSIMIDVDDDDWKVLKLKAGDRVKVWGEVDTHRYKPTDIDVIKIERVK